MKLIPTAVQYFQQNHINCSTALNKDSGTKLKGQFLYRIIKTLSSNIRHDLLLPDPEKPDLCGVKLTEKQNQNKSKN